MGRPAWLTSSCRVLALLLPIMIVVGAGAADLVASLLAVAMIGAMIVSRDRSVLCHGWFKVSLVLWLFMLAAAPFALADVGAAMGRAATFLRFPVLAAALGLWLLAEREWRDRYVTVLLAVVLFSAAWAIVEWIWIKQIIGFYGRPLRLYGPFADKKVGIFLAKMMFPCLGLAVAWAAAGTGRRLFVVAAGALTVFVAIFFSGERSAFLLAGLGLVIFALAVPVARIRRFMIALIALSMAMGAVAYAVSPKSFDRQIKSTIRVLSAFESSSYGILWRSGVEVGLESPLIGSGGKNFRKVCPEIRSPDIRIFGEYNDVIIFCSTHPHSAYIEIFSEYGFVGVFLFLVILGMLVTDVRRRLSDPVTLGAAIGVFIVLWPLVPHGSFFSNWNGIVFWSLVGIMVSRGRTVRD